MSHFTPLNSTPRSALQRACRAACIGLAIAAATTAATAQDVRISDDVVDRKSTRLNSSHIQKSRMPSSA